MKTFVALLLSTLCLVGVAQAQTFTPLLTLKWEDKSSDETAFAIERGLSVTGPFTEIATVGANTITYIDTTISSETLYCYRLRAVNEAGPSGYSNIQCGSSVAVSEAPTGLLFTAQSPAPKLQWTDAATNEAGFAIERGTLQSGPFTEVVTVAANTSTYTDTYATPTIAACYRVRSFNTRTINSKIEKQYSGYSNVMCRSAVPATPANLILAAQTQATATKQSLTDAQADLAKARVTNSYTTRLNAIKTAQSKVNAAQITLLVVTNKMVEAQQQLAVQE